MNTIDFFIGLTLVNALPHFVLGIWNGRMLSLFGLSPRANLAYGILNFVTCIALCWATYGWQVFLDNGIIAGGCFVIIGYFVIGRSCHRWFHLRSKTRDTSA